MINICIKLLKDSNLAPVKFDFKQLTLNKDINPTFIKLLNPFEIRKKFKKLFEIKIKDKLIKFNNNLRILKDNHLIGDEVKFINYIINESELNTYAQKNEKIIKYYNKFTHNQSKKKKKIK